jgi:hypothetical protein
MQKKNTLGGRKRYVTWLMEHRKIDVDNFIECVYKELETWNDWDGQERRKVDHWFEDLRNDLDDIDCAILDVLLAKNIDEAKSIAESFRATCQEH